VESLLEFLFGAPVADDANVTTEWVRMGE